VRLVVVCLLALVACGDGGGGGGGESRTDDSRPRDNVGAAPATTPAGVTPGHDAWVDVTVANLWAEPDQVRPLDTPSLTRPVDIDAWLAAMTVDDRRWLVDRLVTQALYGDRVTVDKVSGEWAKVVVVRQPTSLDPRGYPGWLPTVQLSPRPGPSSTPDDAIVVGPTQPLRDPADPGRVLFDVSFNTRLPIIGADRTAFTVGLPGGGVGILDASGAVVTTAGRPPPTGDQLVRSAQMFGGVEYLWAGTSAWGWDCSGFTSAVYAANGIVIARDAHDQAAAGTPVDRADLQPGDLLFFAPGADRNSIHHVGMYVGGGRMIQAPATGRSVEIVSIDQPGLVSGYWGARRYLPPPG
jgi:cell wall-associated NlpC family hydrolase